jgi:hypothetical protein
MKFIYIIICFILWIFEKIFFRFEWIFSWLNWKCLCSYNWFIKKLIEIEEGKINASNFK